MRTYDDWKCDENNHLGPKTYCEDCGHTCSFASNSELACECCKTCEKEQAYEAQAREQADMSADDVDLEDS